MSDEYILELIRQMLEGKKLNQNQLDAIREWIRGKLSEGSKKAFTSDATKPPRKPTIWERLRRLLRRFPRKALRALWIVPIYLAIALLVDMNLDPQPIGGGLGACAIDATPVPLSAKERSFGPKSALADAQDELARQCNTAAIDCTDPACPTCGNDVFVSTVDITSYLLFYVAEVTGDCRCWCR
jgi:hypothetical protein